MWSTLHNSMLAVVTMEYHPNENAVHSRSKDDRRDIADWLNMHSLNVNYVKKGSYTASDLCCYHQQIIS